MEDKKSEYALLTITEEQNIIQAIREAEQNTSGEIRVHISSKEGSGTLEYAQKIFKKLNMHKTKYGNGILLHVSYSEKAFSVVGGEGIHQKVKQDFWDQIRDGITEQFRQGNFYEGILYAVKQSGEKLTHYFPVADDDKNELPDEITFS